MPSAFAHAIAGIALGKLFTGKKQPVKFWLLTLVCAAIPDADVIAFKFGISYHSMWGHRGFTHSITFSLLLGFLVAFLFFADKKWCSPKWWTYMLYFSTVTFSHALLDAMTNGGLGCAFFAPVSAERFFFPFRPIQVSPLSISRFFSEWGVRVMTSEFIWIWVPCLVIIFLVWVGRRVRE